MRVMGIDPSTKTGIAVVDSGKKVIYTEEIEFKKQTGFERISNIAGRVLELREIYQPDLITIEEMIVGQASSAITVIQVASILRYFLWQEGVRYWEVNPSTLKKFVSGGGAAKKEEMMMYVLKNWGFQSKTNNIADAVGLAMIGLCAGKNEKFSHGSTMSCTAALKKYPLPAFASLK